MITDREELHDRLAELRERAALAEQREQQLEEKVAALEEKVDGLMGIVSQGRGMLLLIGACSAIVGALVAGWGTLMRMIGGQH